MINLQPSLRPSLSPSLRKARRTGGGLPPAAQTAQLLLLPDRGLYKDVAGTIPATVAGDKIACWKDMRNGLLFTQATVAAQPMLAVVAPTSAPTVRFAEGQYLALTHNFPALVQNVSAVFGCCPSDDNFSVFDGPNVTGNYDRSSVGGYGYVGTFLTTRLDNWMPFPASGKTIASISNENSYNGRINGTYVTAAAIQTINNTGNQWVIGNSAGIDVSAWFAGDVFGIAILAAASPAAIIDDRATVEQYISQFYPPLSAAVIATTGKGTSAGGGHTDPIDTTGAKLIVLNLAYYTGGTLTGVHDSQGNTYTPLDAHIDVASGVIQQLWYCENPLTGPAHQFQINGATIFASVQAAAFGGDITAAHFDQQTGAAGSGSSLAIGPVGQSGVYSLVVAGVGFSDTTPGPITGTGGFTVLGTTPHQFGQHFGGGLAFKFSDAMIIHNITWDLAAPMSGIAAGIATFQAT